ncbi:MAG: hypothetical protein QOG04_447 [Actinomycetota bacterium]|jgi:Flp pilus assembly pilin Flp|nr:hypothetical protein [Actinomycetota bacterium]
MSWLATLGQVHNSARGERGATAVEKALLLALVAGLIIVALRRFV